ncbi:MAG: ATP-binding cassette domain-containing protein [Gammaproteobacteria bacterium]|nr:ATP-binding cassette domain-containing protein [Gammaproteobacteria bacterium]
MASTDKIIEIKNACVYRGDTKVFESLTLEIEQGKNTAIVGPNGAGKTTLLKLLSRELYPVHSDSSYVRIFGQDRWNVWELRSRLGIVSHDLQEHYAGHVRGIEVVLSGYYSSIGVYKHQRFSAGARQHAREVMATLDSAELEDKLFAEMSTGQQRRCLLGRALINKPQTLILDEPTTGLDLNGTFKYLDIVRRLMREGRTVILVTHHLHEIPPEVAWVVLLKDGEVMAQGDKKQILTDDRLSELFDTSIHLVSANGFYQAIPGTT